MGLMLLPLERSGRIKSLSEVSAEISQVGPAHRRILYTRRKNRLRSSFCLT